MIFKEFGNKNMPTIVFLHGGGLSFWSFKEELSALKNSYRIVTPIIDGHGEDYNNTFISISNSAKHVINYIQESCNGHVFCICGLSLGAQILVEVLSLKHNISEYAVIESALVYPIKLSLNLMVAMNSLAYGLIKKKWFAKLQAKTLNVPQELFETYYKESSKMTKETLINITKSNGSYPMPNSICNTTASTLILVGERELSIMKKSAKLLNETIDNSILNIIPKAKHGEISLAYPKQYLDLLNKLFNSKK
ncbi:pimeloyl-ACP methyl ester carboxylesterase [Clostridium acetobutylicum]|uniref:Alpha/beta superfamily hydrolase n=1 Tax=Clostridium acetobutylicum (strain ATCC 824 / DSM 792 / JCM 1419 / IAM 19013 / LMG 5710 / NBRC 13948 / NRRL B-527 / VKM B-1787 / 2291 / W) TaxID=272562 RepID=Q97G97_CLOAB|nr:MULTISPECIES: alpha/beta hydrolase [Clostridium]AAK80426.1 Alpha/beta superfamily hydrolase [Clostridium acetobutylicum ATCC 824]ADZ21523.1 Alpha/beta superfamily hydrolase [Clostridium acetobutylicum EA 2018]AEI32368.1 alpha/beta fold family hydrolase [Clostridium acetobutylicum DSM 1731]AWV79157.1 alpha/beta hydrolase [Clostridium acetobutylicum]MBC2394880.1 alpha/beta hydrolase [Clostridium acetobutylicum]